MPELNAALSRPAGRSFGLELRSVFYTLMLALLALVVLYPLALLLFHSFIVTQPNETQVFGLGNWTLALSQPGMVNAVVNTFSRVLVTELVSFPLGILLAWLLARTNLPGKGVLDFFMWIAFFLPTLPVLMGWILLFDPDFGLANHLAKTIFALEKGPFNIYSFWGIVWAHLVTRSVASKYIFLAPAFRNLDASLEEASRVGGVGTIGTLLRIVVPVMAPAILVTLIISLIHSLESFETELILGPPFNFYVYSTMIYKLIAQEVPQFGPATALSVVILITMLPLIFYQYRVNTRKNFTTVTSHFRTNVLPLRAARWPIFAIVFGFGLLITVLPIVFLLMGTFMRLFGFFNIDGAWTLEHWERVLSDPILIHSLWNTLELAGGAALVGMLWYSVIAYISARTKYRGRGAIDFISWLPAAIPGIILGLGMLWMFLETPFLRPLYGTIFVLIIAVTINSMTTGVQLIKSNMVQLGKELEEASAVAGGSWWYTYRRIIFPILAPAILSVGTITFISASRNISNIAMLVTNDNRPIAMLQLDFMVDGRYESAAITGIFVVLMTIGVALAARYLGKRIGIRV